MQTPGYQSLQKYLLLDYCYHKAAADKTSGT